MYALKLKPPLDVVYAYIGFVGPFARTKNVEVVIPFSYNESTYNFQINAKDNFCCSFFLVLKVKSSYNIKKEVQI